MILPSLAFYLFAAMTVACGVMVIASRNPVHSVLFLILAFFNSAGLFVLMGAEFLAMIPTNQRLSFAEFLNWEDSRADAVAARSSILITCLRSPRCSRLRKLHSHSRLRSFTDL